METRAARSRGEVVALVVVALTAAAFLVLAAGRITARFGDSDEGINAAVWSTNARALRDLGPLESHLGGRRQDDSRYATHPPTIVVATAVAQAVAGDHPWSDRAPAWIATVVALALLYGLGRRAGFDPAAAAGAVAAVGLTPMILVYGPMLDTPVVCLPFGLVVAGLWYRSWRDDHPVALGWIVLAGMLAGLAGWQAAVLTGLCGLSLLARSVQRRSKPGGRSSLRSAVPFLVGAGLGVGLSLTWSWWVYGDFHTLATKFGGRSGTSSGVGLGDMISFQVPWLFNLLGLSIVGLVGCVVALRDQRVRPLAALALASVGVYALIFRQAAAGHQYWNYWAVFPAAIGWGYLLHLLARELSGPRESGESRRAVGAIAVLVTGVCLFNLVPPNRAADYIADGQRAADLVADTSFPADQSSLPYIGQPYRPDAWIAYNTGRSPVAVTTLDQLRALAADHPDELVLVLGSCDPGDASFDFCASVVSPGLAHLATANNPPQMLSAAEIVHRLERSGD
jgi:MFS family permease